MHRVLRIAAIVTLSVASTLSTGSVAGSASITNDRAAAARLYEQIQSISDRMDAASQHYDLARIKLSRVEHAITTTRIVASTIALQQTRDRNTLRADVVYAYVTGENVSNDATRFLSSPSDDGSRVVYLHYAEGRISTAMVALRNTRQRLNAQRRILASEVRRAATATATARGAVEDARALLGTLHEALSKVTSDIATYIREQQAAAAAAATRTLQSAKPIVGYPAIPFDDRASVVIRAAFSLLGVPYVWGGASRRGVDCSGLILLAYAAAGIFLPHYSGFQFAATQRVPLFDLRPGDILFYGKNGDDHETLYIGNGKVIQAERTGTVVQITPIWFGPDFAGIGRPIAR
ncbi:MAG: C40 family peptidase [Acidimicrobiales bacterium]